jgi:hypothetical protein
MGRWRRGTAAVLVCLVPPAVGACSSGDDGATTTTAPADGSVVTTTPDTTPDTTPITSPDTRPITTPDTTPDTTPSSSIAPTTSGGTSPTMITQDDVESITTAFDTFFGGMESTVDEKVAVLQDGERYREMLVAASENEQFQQMSTEIRDVRAATAGECQALEAGDDCAVVTHDVLVAGFPMAAGIESPAVRAAGGWLVGARAWCRLVEIGGETCPDAESAP